MREIRMSGLRSGTWKRSRAELLRHRQTKGPATDRLKPKPPRHVSTLHMRPGIPVDAKLVICKFPRVTNGDFLVPKRLCEYIAK